MEASAKTPFTLAHLAGVLVAILVVGSIIETMSGSSSPVQQDITANVLSKAAWREKVRPYWNPGGSIKVTTVANFKSLMGEPSLTQTDGDTGHAYWFYSCSDGTVEIDLIDPNMTRGTMAINSISDF
jgi:hypothetical protein